jgi:hypothetical protein
VHVTLTRVNSTDQPPENAGIVAEEMHGWLRDIEGYEGMLMLASDEQTIGITFWRTREDAERNSALRLEFLERMISVAGVEMEERIDLDVRFAQLGQAVNDVTG